MCCGANGATACAHIVGSCFVNASCHAWDVVPRSGCAPSFGLASRKRITPSRPNCVRQAPAGERLPLVSQPWHDLTRRQRSKLRTVANVQYGLPLLWTQGMGWRRANRIQPPIGTQLRHGQPALERRRLSPNTSAAGCLRAPASSASHHHATYCCRSGNEVNRPRRRCSSRHRAFLQYQQRCRLGQGLVFASQLLLQLPDALLVRLGLRLLRLL